MALHRIFVGVSQRVDIVAARDERRDALDQRWPKFLAACGCTALPLPNRAPATVDMLDALNPIGVVLTGGNDLAAVGGDAPERDEAERAMLNWASARGAPVIGVCRGMQMIISEYGAQLKRLDAHIGTRHRLVWQGRPIEVNSYHGWGANMLPRDLETTAKSDDGCIEAFRHTSKPVFGIMWHPEREMPFADHDIAFFRSIFGSPR